MRVFAKDSSYPTLVHCAHGKDRTGVIIMLLLLVCDAPHEAIVQDYVQVGGRQVTGPGFAFRSLRCVAA